jgi:hypothetical protein
MGGANSAILRPAFGASSAEPGCFVFWDTVRMLPLRKRSPIILSPGKGVYYVADGGRASSLETRSLEHCPRRRPATSPSIAALSGSLAADLCFVVNMSPTAGPGSSPQESR